MKKIIFIISILSTFLQADEWSLSGGGGLWDVTSEGRIVETLNSTVAITDELSDTAQKGYLFVDLRHHLPIVPNVRLEYVDVAASGKGKTVSLTDNIFGVPTSVGTDVTSTLTLTQYDIIAYYRLLDHAHWISLDLGADMKYVSSHYVVDSLSVDESSDSWTPLLYLRGRVDIASSGIGVETDMKYITDGTSTLSDIRVKADYTMNFIPIVHPSLELGYRMEKFDIDGESSNIIGPIISGDTDVDISFSGVYGGVSLVF